MRACPIVFASVPNQSVPVGRWKIMWRTVPPPLGIGVGPTNSSVAGSNPTRRLGWTPVSENQIRSRSSIARA